MCDPSFVIVVRKLIIDGILSERYNDGPYGTIAKMIVGPKHHEVLSGRFRVHFAACHENKVPRKQQSRKRKANDDDIEGSEARCIDVHTLESFISSHDLTVNLLCILIVILCQSEKQVQSLHERLVTVRDELAAAEGKKPSVILSNPNLRDLAELVCVHLI